jgi:hypothetical protein
MTRRRVALDGANETISDHRLRNDATGLGRLPPQHGRDLRDLDRPLPGSVLLRRDRFRRVEHAHDVVEPYFRAGTRIVLVLYTIPLGLSLALVVLEPIWARVLFALLSLTLVAANIDTAVRIRAVARATGSAASCAPRSRTRSLCHSSCRSSGDGVHGHDLTLSILHRHDETARRLISEIGGRLVKQAGPDPTCGSPTAAAAAGPAGLGHMPWRAIAVWEPSRRCPSSGAPRCSASCSGWRVMTYRRGGSSSCSVRSRSWCYSRARLGAVPASTMPNHSCAAP